MLPATPWIIMLEVAIMALIIFPKLRLYWLQCKGRKKSGKHKEKTKGFDLKEEWICSPLQQAAGEGFQKVLTAFFPLTEEFFGMDCVKCLFPDSSLCTFVGVLCRKYNSLAKGRLVWISHAVAGKVMLCVSTSYHIYLSSTQGNRSSVFPSPRERGTIECSHSVLNYVY